MAKEISVVGLIRQAVVEKGYIELKDVTKKECQTIYYVHEKSSQDVVNVLELTYKPALKAYGVHAGLYNPTAEGIVRSLLPELRKFLHPLVVKSIEEREADCLPMLSGQFFEACRFLGWRRLVIPDPNDRNGWPQKIDELFQNFLEPIFFQVKNIEDIKNFLLRTEPTFEWFTTNAILRVSLIVVLDSLCNNPDPDLRSRLYTFKDDINHALKQSEIQDCNALLDFLYISMRV